MQHERYKAIAMIITAAKTNICKANISAYCIWIRSETVLCSMQKRCLGISHSKTVCINYTLVVILVFLLIFMKIHGYHSVDMQTNSNHCTPAWLELELLENTIVQSVYTCLENMSMRICQVCL